MHGALQQPRNIRTAVWKIHVLELRVIRPEQLDASHEPTYAAEVLPIFRRQSQRLDIVVSPHA